MYSGGSFLPCAILSGLVVLTMPIMAPLEDFSNVSRDLVITAYQSASGVVMGGLAIFRVSYNKWIAFIWPLLVILSVFLMVVLSAGTLV